MNGLLNTYARSINILQHVATMYRAKYDGWVRFCNKLTMELPWRLEDALEDEDEINTPHSILWFVFLYEWMMKRFKSELKELKERKAKCVI